MSETKEKEVLGAKDTPDTRFLSAKEKFNLLMPERRIQLLSSMSDEDAAKLNYDWDFNGRPKQLAPDYEKSRATSFCMCKFLEAQSQTDKQLKLEQFPSCHGRSSIEVIVDENGKQTLVHHDEPKVCQFRLNWSVWVLLAGRGFGKTRVGAELVRHMVESGQAKRIHIIAPTAADARDVAVEGESGLLNISPPWNKPLYESTKRRITWPNGAVASLFSAEEPERLRGPQCDFAWTDELAAWDPNVQQMVWDMMNFGLRLGKNPRAVVTTTPKPTVLIQNLVKQAKDPVNRTIITTGSTYENRSNLAAPFMRQITQYEGTNLGRQEIYAELIDIEESGILKRSWLKRWPASKPMPNIEFVLQSYDTAFTAQTENDPTGCLVFGIFRPAPDEPHCVMILDAWTDHLKYPELRKKTAEDYRNTYGDQDAKVDMLLIEDKGSGIPLIQDLQRAGLPIRKYNPGRPDKVMRLHAVSHLVYNGRVYVPESKKVPGEFVTWAEDFIREVCSFPNSPHDEYVDCLSQGLAFFRDQEWINIDPAPEKDIWEDEDSWEDEQKYSNPYAA
jgi:predicted phage terminase large subunit-like protein